MSLDREMVRYFEYMRPRRSNLTYSSTNVCSTLGMPYSQSYQPSIQTPPAYHPQIRTISTQNRQAVQKPAEEPKKSIPSKPAHKKSRSQLSSYGTSSLGTLPKFVSERDIYEKQEKKYNIISIQPKRYQETIKKYPKFHLEDLDQNYYKKLQLQNQYMLKKTSPNEVIVNPEPNYQINPENKPFPGNSTSPDNQ